MLVSSKEEVKAWKRNFEHLMNGDAEVEAIVMSMGIEAGGKMVFQHRAIERVDVEKAITKIKAAGIHRITPEMVKHGRSVVDQWIMLMICD